MECKQLMLLSIGLINFLHAHAVFGADEKSAVATTAAVEKDALPCSRLQKYRPKPLRMTEKNMAMMDKPLDEAKVCRCGYPEFWECESAPVDSMQEINSSMGRVTPNIKNRYETLIFLESIAYPGYHPEHATKLHHWSRLLNLEASGYGSNPMLTRKNTKVRACVAIPASNEVMGNLMQVAASRDTVPDQYAHKIYQVVHYAQQDQQSASSVNVAAKSSTKLMITSQVISALGAAAVVVSNDPKKKIAGVLAIAASQAMAGDCVVS